MLLEQCKMACFCFNARFLRHRNMLERNAVKRGQAFDVAMVRYDHWNVAIEFARAPAMQQVGHAVQVLRTEQSHAWTAGAGSQCPAHSKFCRQRSKCGFEALKIKALEPRRARCRLAIVLRQVKPKLHAHEKQAPVVVLVLVGMQNVGASLIEHAGHSRHQPLAVGAVNQQNSRIFHRLSRLQRKQVIWCRLQHR